MPCFAPCSVCPFISLKNILLLLSLSWCQQRRLGSNPWPKDNEASVLPLYHLSPFSQNVPTDRHKVWLIVVNFLPTSLSIWKHSHKQNVYNRHIAPSLVFHHFPRFIALKHSHRHTDIQTHTVSVPWKHSHRQTLKFGSLWPTSILPLFLYLNELSEKCYHK